MGARGGDPGDERVKGQSIRIGRPVAVEFPENVLTKSFYSAGGITMKSNVKLSHPERVTAHYW